MAQLGNTIINGILRVNGNINSSGTISASAFSGNLTGNVTGNVSGNAGTATKLQTARTINGVSFDGSSNITVADSTKLPLSGGSLTGRITVQAAGQTTPRYDNTQFMVDTPLNQLNPSIGFREQGTSDGTLYMHQRALYWSSSAAVTNKLPAANTGYELLHAGNFQNYAAPLKGGDNYVKVYGAGVNGTNSETITPVDLAKKDFAMGMIHSATDNPWGEARWNHIISMNWSKGITSAWVSQIAVGVEKGIGMFYRASSGNISGKAWTRLIDSANYSTYVPMTHSGTAAPADTLGKDGDIYVLLES